MAWHLQGTAFSPAQMNAVRDVLALSEREAKKAQATLQRPEQRGKMAERFAAATMVRTPQLLRGILLLLDARLAFEAEVVVRVLVELAITALWVADDEDRAEWVRDDGILSERVRWDRIKNLGVRLDPEFDEWVKRPIFSHEERLPSLEQRARESELPAWAVEETDAALPSFGIMLYDLSYRLLSGSVHVGLEPASLIAAGAPLLGEALGLALMACLALLAALRDPLQLDDVEIEKLVRVIQNQLGTGAASA